MVGLRSALVYIVILSGMISRAGLASTTKYVVPTLCSVTTVNAYGKIIQKPGYFIPEADCVLVSLKIVAGWSKIGVSTSTPPKEIWVTFPGRTRIRASVSAVARDHGLAVLKMQPSAKSSPKPTVAQPLLIFTYPPPEEHRLPGISTQAASSLATVADLGTFIGIVLALFFGQRMLRNRWRSANPRESVAVFGPKAVGKTTLIRYLQGRPLPKKHIDTYGYQDQGKVVCDLSGNETAFFRSERVADVGGEHMNVWSRVIERQNPNGIIYMVDTTKEREESEGVDHIGRVYRNWLERIDTSDEDEEQQVLLGAGGLPLSALLMRIMKLRLGKALSRRRHSSRPRLRSVLILVNKCDVWGTGLVEKGEVMKRYREAFVPRMKDRLPLTDLDFDCEYVSLTDCDYATRVSEVLRRFSVSLNHKGVSHDR